MRSRSKQIAIYWFKNWDSLGLIIGKNLSAALHSLESRICMRILRRNWECYCRITCTHIISMSRALWKYRDFRKCRDFRNCRLLPETEIQTKMRRKENILSCFCKIQFTVLRTEWTGIFIVSHHRHRCPLTQLTQRSLQTQNERKL